MYSYVIGYKQDPLFEIHLDINLEHLQKKIFHFDPGRIK
jgi:hypothetical protein